MPDPQHDPVPEHKLPAITIHWSIRLVVSAALLLHLAAVIAPPLSFSASAPREAGLLPQRLFFGLRPYIDAMNLNHGYAFFAPDPGDSFILRYEVTFNDDREPIRGWLPDLDDHWPRLLYHRHFMLADQLNMQFLPGEPPPGMDPADVAQLKLARKSYEIKLQSFKDHLLALHQADQVEIIRVRHVVPDLFEFQNQPRPLDDPATYIDQSDEFGGDADSDAVGNGTGSDELPESVNPNEANDNTKRPTAEPIFPFGAGS